LRSRIPDQKLLQPECVSQKQDPPAAAKHLHCKLSRRGAFFPHAIKDDRERNSNQKQENGSRKTAEKLAQPKPFTRSVLRAYPAIQDVALEHDENYQTPHPVEIRKSI